MSRNIVIMLPERQSQVLFVTKIILKKNKLYLNYDIEMVADKLEVDLDIVSEELDLDIEVNCEKN